MSAYSLRRPGERELDERGDTVALCEAVDTSGIGLAVMNRMGRAAAFDIETV